MEQEPFKNFEEAASNEGYKEWYDAADELEVTVTNQDTGEIIGAVKLHKSKLASFAESLHELYEHLDIEKGQVYVKSLNWREEE